MVEFSSPNASSSGLIFRPVTTLLCKLAIILFVAFWLFYLVAALSQCLCSQNNKKKNGEVVEYSLLAKRFFKTNNPTIVYVPVCAYDFHCKTYNSYKFFIAYCQGQHPTLTPLLSRKGGTQTDKGDHHQEDFQTQYLTINSQQP